MSNQEQKNEAPDAPRKPGKFEGVTVSIGIPLPRFHGFEVDVMPVVKQCLSDLCRFSKDRGVNVYMIPKEIGRGLHVARNHTDLANAMMGDWLLIVGSDHGFHEAALLQLLDAALDNDGNVVRPIISGICPSRGKPHRAMAFRRDKTGKNFMPFRPWLDFTESDCIRGSVIDKPYDGVGGGMDIACGSGFCLYHRSVFDAVPYPWFDAGVRMEDLGNYGPDIRLSSDAHKCGIGSAVHCGVMYEHYDMQAINIGRYIQHVNQGKDYIMAEIHALNNDGVNEKSVQDVVKIWDDMEKRRKQAEAEEREFDDAQTVEGGETESVCGAVHEQQGSAEEVPEAQPAA